MIDTRELKELVDKLQDKSRLKRAVASSLYNATEYVRKESIKPNSHKWESRGGVLGSAHKLNVSGLSSSIFVDLREAPYGEYLYEGRKPFIIRPKNKKALSDGETVFAHVNGRFGLPKEVRHPGFKADPWILNTYEKNKKKFNKIFETDLIEEIQGAL